MYAMLGTVPFELLQSFTSLEESHDATFAKHDVLAGRPRLQALGNDLTKIRFGVRLHWRLGDVDTAYNGLVSAKEAQEALALVFGSGRFVGWFAIESLTARTLIQDGSGRTAARELDVSLTEFVGDPNNPLPTPGLAIGQNPLLAMLPESIRPILSDTVQTVQTAVRLYRQAQTAVSDVQSLLIRVRGWQHNPAAALASAADILHLGATAAGCLNALPEWGKGFARLDGAADFLRYSAQALHDLNDGLAVLHDGFASGALGSWLDDGMNCLSRTSDSLENAAAGAQSLAAWLAVRKDS